MHSKIYSKWVDKIICINILKNFIFYLDEKEYFKSNDRARILMEYSALGKKLLLTEISRRTRINAEAIRAFVNRYNAKKKISKHFE